MALTRGLVTFALMVHLALTILTCVQMGWNVLTGRPSTLMRWFAGHLLATIALMAASDLGSQVQDSSYWMMPFAFLALWGWWPSAVALWGELYARIRANWLARRAVRHRAPIEGRDIPIQDGLP